VLIGSVAISAVLNIFVLFARELDDFGVRKLGTTLFVSAAALLVMANLAAIETQPRGYYYLSIIGLVMALVALPILLTALWVGGSEIGPGGTLWNIGASLEIASLVTALSTLLRLWRPRARYRSMVPVATALALALGSLSVIMIWTGMGGDAVSDTLLSIGDLYNSYRYD
jgi:hypothetical protein